MGSKSRANIVYMMGDGLKASATSVCGGNPHVPCRFMERMADSGVAFREAYAANPICTPSRASVMTGVHPLVHGVTCHQNRAPHNLPQLAELLAAGGYYTAACGHYELNRNLGRGWTEQCDEGAPGALRAAYRMWQNAGRRDIGWPSGTMPCTVEECHSHRVTDRAIHMIDAMRRAEMPFFLHVAYNDPHPPYFVAPPYDTMVDPDSIDLPSVGEHAPDWQTAARSVFRTAEAAEADLRRVVAVYYGMIALLNDEMARVCDALAERGMLENTWIILAGDHGDYTGEKGMFSHTESLYECLLHVPLIIRPPERVDAPRGERVSGLVDLVDLFPTILGMAGIEPPDYAQGHDLVRWVQGDDREPLRDCVFAQVGDYHGHLGTTLPGGRPGCTRHPALVQGARTREFAYVRDPDFGDEAYDLRRDPAELDNLLEGRSGPEPDEVAHLRRRVAEWETECLRLRERLGVVPGWRGFDRGWE